MSVNGAETTYAKLDRSATVRAFQSLRRELGVEGFGINLVTLGPRERGRIHSHDVQEEVYLVLTGELTLGLEGEKRLLGPDEIARVPAGLRRQLVNAGTVPLVLLALGGSGEHAGRDGHAWGSWEEPGPGLPPQEVPLPDDLPAP